MSKKVSVLFVCLANICRSPAAEGILRHMHAKRKASFELHVESCGIGDWQEGQLVDERMRQAAEMRGVALHTRARMLHARDIQEFDYILAADQRVLHALYKWAATPDLKAKIHLMTHFSQLFPKADVQDPFFEHDSQFESVLDVLEDACSGLLDHLESTQ